MVIRPGEKLLLLSIPKCKMTTLSLLYTIPCMHELELAVPYSRQAVLQAVKTVQTVDKINKGQLYRARNESVRV